MLPFDNKSEFQVILNMPEGSALERTAQAAREIAAAVRIEPEVTDYQIYAGVAAPFNFNGLVRHYFMRRGANVADIQVNLVRKGERKAQSHDIAKRVRPRVAEIAAKYGARVAVAEVPPGPPVLQTLVAEIYGPNEDEPARARATRCSDIFKSTPGVVDMDWYIEADQPKARFVIDKEKAALHGISAETISQTLRIAVGGESVDLLHVPREKEDVNIMLELPRSAAHHAGGIARAARPLRRRQRAARARRRRHRAARAVARTGARRADHDREKHLPQEPDARDLRHRRRGRRGRKPGLCDPEDEQGACEARHARVRRRRRAAAKSTTPSSPSPMTKPAHEMGRRMAHHHRSLPRSRHGLRRRAGADLRADGRLVPRRSSRR